MVDKNTDFLKCVDNFEKTANIPSIPIFEANISEPPLVTIAIPTYKRAKYLIDAIDSALNQEGIDNYIVIVVDNNPERGDETEQLLLSYNNPKLSYYKNAENLGMAGNWNRCFSLSQSKWVTLLHDDDFYFPEFLKTMISAIDKNPQIDGLSAYHYRWDVDKEKEKISVVEPTIRKKYSGGVAKVNMFDMFMSHYIGPVGILFQKNKVEALGGFNQDYYPSFDYIFNTNYLLHYNLFILDRILLHYRWGYNESVNPQTVLKTITIDYFFNMQLTKLWRLRHYNEKFVIAKAGYRYIIDLKLKYMQTDLFLESCCKQRLFPLFCQLGKIYAYWFRVRTRLLSYINSY